ncbi:hypothetical protein BJY16_005388 [Actinoplanes octamycinicus]|uniref:Uncharacterized protein n=1 Tax=Actinoplanes octamycinicus TaxID=135948 RepID=A0A7W7H163_9ACTN|nr:hypothetical protein [Actinoplanes octamycinicus]MBB4741929.1 hypothetical protein [Actinoplanes octamycinicus]GIE60693.1 hypothetical protein Aoc01nite_60950 [Actinoplanes octamycinicus]
MRSRWFVAALLLTAVTAFALLLLPTVAVHRSGSTDRVVSLGADQPAVAPVLAAPVLLCALPLLVPRRCRRGAAWAGVTALTIVVLLGLLSVGLFFVPGAILMAIGAVRLDDSDS